MSRIKGKNTKPELLVRKFLFKNGFRYTLHDKKLPGKPDIVFTKRKIAIFVHGCFWHGHTGCKYFVIPKSRTEWWLNKINGNKNKDLESIMKLEELGWEVIVIWECDLKAGNLQITLDNLLIRLKN